jgi:exonuclease VII small subunit
MELLTREMLMDSLNLAKIVYKKGLTGLLILGENKRQLFTALPEHFSVSDHDIHIIDSVELMQEKKMLEQLSIELSKNGQIDPEILIIVTTSKSMSEVKIAIDKSLKRKKAENNQLQQISQEYEKAQQSLKEMQTQLQQASQQIQKLNSDKMELDRQKLQQDKELGWFKAKSEDNYKDQMAEINKKRVELEALQLIDTNPNNNEVKNN